MPKPALNQWLPFVQLNDDRHGAGQPGEERNRPLPKRISRLHHKILNSILLLVTVGYPFLVWFSRDYVQPRSLALILAGLFLLRGLLQKERLTGGMLLIAPACVLFLLTVALINQNSWLLTYPAFVSLLFFTVFSYSLAYPPTLVERLARLEDPQLPAKGVAYTRKVTLVWCVFFLTNATVSLATVWYGDPWLWSLYNGCVSYILTGLLMAAEMVVRRKVKASY
ncbi:hypothetical protein [Methylomonas sp. LL1]|uniref:COG4648 family protein n=1 Tax=Methylomonas sp. LL1 TaxID=2785785 RepID=UPI001E342AC7|nr:hypothetical protein [Methylomonas sp. LL1]